MQIATIIIFLILIISAPWISRRWGDKGALVWSIISIAFLVGALLLLD